jgi:hypothetical protein
MTTPAEDICFFPDDRLSPIMNELANQLEQDRRDGILSELAYSHRLRLLQYFYKVEYNNKYKLPIIPKHLKGRGCKQGYKALTELYKSTLNLCIELHIQPYRSAFEWFSLIFLEAGIERVNYCSDVKKSSQQDLKKENRALKKYENPIDKSRFPHTWALIEIAKENSKKFSGTRYRYWHPLVQNRNTWADCLKLSEWNGLQFVDAEHKRPNESMELHQRVAEAVVEISLRSGHPFLFAIKEMLPNILIE